MRHLLTALTATLSLWSACCTSAPAASETSTVKRPNILFIYTNDQSWRTVSCYRDDGARPWVRTPNTDRLAKEGVRFTHAYGASFCVPSRATVMTGHLPHAIQGLHWNLFKNSRDPSLCRYWPSEFRKAGYETMLIGKWHLGNDAGQGREWDHSVVWRWKGIGRNHYFDPTLMIDGGPLKPVTGYSTDLYTQFTVDFINRPHDRPWYLWLCYNSPHLPIIPHPRHRDRYVDVDIPIPKDISGPRPGKPKYMQTLTSWKQMPDQSPFDFVFMFQSLEGWVRGYNQMICSLDEGVGQIVDALKESGQLDNTLIVFTSDQGFAWGEHGFAGKTGPYDACMRMPMIVRLPGKVAQGAVCKYPVALVDLPPTFFAMAEIPLPWEMDGHDLSPILKDPQAPWDHPVLLEHVESSFGHQTDKLPPSGKKPAKVPWWIFLTEGKYKYIRTLVPNEIDELYDLEADPGEFNNLALDPNYDAVRDQFRAKFIAELKRTHAGIVNNLPPLANASQ